MNANATRPRRAEAVLFWSLAAIAAMLRIALLLRYRFDSDEPQHLHVTWGWTAGFVQYRDIFDNHAPLFHLATAPLLALFGERSDILLLMRVPMLALFGVTLWATWKIARAHWDGRVAAWSVIVLAVFPPFALKTIEYRTDNLWTALWMVALALLATGTLSGARLFLGGLLLGAALATSMKTLLLLMTFAIAGLMFRAIRGGSVQVAKVAGPFVAGFAIVPAFVVAGFAVLGALDKLWYGVIGFNSLATGDAWHVWGGRIAWPLLLVAVYQVARRRSDVRGWPSFLALFAAVYCVTVVSLWTLITPRDFLAVMPLLAILSTAALLSTAHPLRFVAVFCIVSLVGVYYYADRLENRTDEHITMMDQVLRLTRPGEPLMDIKGETIYQKRPFYHAFEAITRRAMRDGMIQDTIAQSMIDARCYVAQADGPFLPPLGRQFMRRNYVNLGRIRAAGQFLAPDGTFSIAIPGEYVFVNERGAAAGSINGAPVSGPRHFEAGPYRFERAVRGENVAVLWAPAFARGHSPFRLRDLEF